MLRTVTALALALLATVAVASAAVLASSNRAAEQPLAVRVSAQGSQVERLDGYVPGQPIAVRVDAPRAQAVTLLGVGPDGGSLRFPLARGADGRYGADVSLTTPGVWSLAVTSQVAGVETASESFAVSVAAGSGTKATIVVLALAIAALAGGLALIAAGLLHAYRRPVVLAE